MRQIRSCLVDRPLSRSRDADRTVLSDSRRSTAPSNEQEARQSLPSTQSRQCVDRLRPPSFLDSVDERGRHADRTGAETSYRNLGAGARLQPCCTRRGERSGMGSCAVWPDTGVLHALSSAARRPRKRLSRLRRRSLGEAEPNGSGGRGEFDIREICHRRRQQAAVTAHAGWLACPLHTSRRDGFVPPPEASGGRRIAGDQVDCLGLGIEEPGGATTGEATRRIEAISASLCA